MNKNVLFDMEETARFVGRKLLEMQPCSRKLKSDKDLLTDADLTASTIIRDRLTNKHRMYAINSEEWSDNCTSEAPQFVIDELDGTMNFLRQDDNWAVSIAFSEDARSRAGVVYRPRANELYSARLGRRTRLFSNGGVKELHVNRKRDFSECQIWVSWGKEKSRGRDHRAVARIIGRLANTSRYPQIRNYAAADMLAVARGQIEGFVFRRPDPQDIAAAGLAVECAGGKVTDFLGRPWSPFSESIVASNGKIHYQLLDLVNNR